MYVLGSPSAIPDDTYFFVAVGGVQWPIQRAANDLLLVERAREWSLGEDAE